MATEAPRHSAFGHGRHLARMRDVMDFMRASVALPLERLEQKEAALMKRIAFIAKERAHTNLRLQLGASQNIDDDEQYRWICGWNLTRLNSELARVRRLIVLRRRFQTEK